MVGQKKGDKAENKMGNKAANNKGEKGQYQKGDKVEYRPIGGSEENVSHSTGTIEDVMDSEDGTARYKIKNDNTGKSTNYQETNIVQKVNE